MASMTPPRIRASSTELSAPHPRHAGAVSRRHLLAACTGLALLSLGCSSAAFADRGLVQVDIVDRDTGQALHVYRDHGRPVVAGRPGARYAVRVVNRTDERVMAVVSIDGVNIVSGETASVDQVGYVLAPRQEASLTGWRKSLGEVAAFEFTALADSYAARTGRPLDVGVIGVAVFREKAPVVPLWSSAPELRRERADAKAAESAARAQGNEVAGAAGQASPSPAPAAAPRAQAQEQPGATAMADAAAPAPRERLGTGHGPREESIVTNVAFERATRQPQQSLAIRYDSFENLVAAGIAPRRLARTAPEPFPADPDSRYVPDPPQR